MASPVSPEKSKPAAMDGRDGLSCLFNSDVKLTRDAYHTYPKTSTF